MILGVYQTAEVAGDRRRRSWVDERSDTDRVGPRKEIGHCLGGPVRSHMCFEGLGHPRSKYVGGLGRPDLVANIIRDPATLVGRIRIKTDGKLVCVFYIYIYIY